MMPSARSFLHHPQWGEVAPCIVIEVYGRDGGPDKPRVRIEVHPPDSATAARWLALTMRCVACGREIHPIRARKGAGNKRGLTRHLYFAPTCPLNVCLPCSRGTEARDEYRAIREAVKPTP
jgi:hypothetical protein